MLKALAAAATIFVGVAILPGAALAGPAEDLDALFDDYWANEMEENPFAATQSGVSGYDDKIPGVAPSDYARRREEAEAFLARLEAIDLSAVDENHALSADLLAFILKHDITLAAYDSWRIPFLADTGFHTNFGYVVSAAPFRTETDYENYIARLKALPAYIDQNIENMRQGLADGFTQPKEILPYIMPSFEAQVKDNAAAHPYYAPFKAMPSAISSRRQSALRQEGKAVLEDEVIPAFARLVDFMRDEYMPGARDTLGAYDLPNGRDYYRDLVRYFTTLDDATPESIHALGLKEVARIRKEMNAVIEETGFDGTFDEFVDFLRTDKQFYPKTPEALLERAAWIAKDIDGRLPGYFGKLPRQPYSVEPVPAEIAPNYTSGRYVSAPPGGTRGGQYWVNTYALDKRPFYEMTALTLHEAVPGHHLQNALALEVEDAPEFRKQFYPHAFGEGWGLYSEKLGVEMGVYQTPYDDFGRLSMEMWRACRLVIDTGLHAKGWTRQQAMDYLADNTALSLHNVQTEVDRYIAWPGQALAYKMGELTLWELREKAERELGDKFDIRDFHDAVLDKGGLPLDILRDEIDDYIAETKAE
ncbi:DUF885 domain-containing protein [Hyphococcus luteus]|uniref:DUF885 domain-containing protein n=1 Tax=Hyphococcus luteus TaxID=2058213 RepID=A0A2S7K4K1_9PROT|nr:DUF885 domain-containing protein [Marinicaulis flavus]PQA87433.1 DUF885 domain-containing protein [Marinicaulis flavus]